MLFMPTFVRNNATCSGLQWAAVARFQTGRDIGTDGTLITATVAVAQPQLDGSNLAVQGLSVPIRVSKWLRLE